MFRQQYLIDVIFHCQNSEAVGSHKIILIQASPIFQEIFYGFGADYFNDDNIIHVSMPEVSKENLSDFLESLYFGAIPTDEEVFQEFKKLCEMFLLFSTYEKPAFMVEKPIAKDISRVEDKVMPILSEVSK